MKMLLLVPVLALLSACGTEEKVVHGLRVGATLTRGACALHINDPALDPRLKLACELILAAPDLPAPPPKD
jgi:hypothetical protein